MNHTVHVTRAAAFLWPRHPQIGELLHRAAYAIDIPSRTCTATVWAHAQDPHVRIYEMEATYSWAHVADVELMTERAANGDPQTVAWLHDKAAEVLLAAVRAAIPDGAA